MEEIFKISKLQLSGWLSFLIVSYAALGQPKYQLTAPNFLKEKAMEIMESQVGVRESGNNTGKEVNKYLASVGLPPGNPYCMSGIYWSWQSASDFYHLNNPLPKTGLANGCFAYAMRCGVKVPLTCTRGDLIVWKYPYNNSGHIEAIDSVINLKMGWVRNIGFNTGSGNPRDGQGVCKTTRNIYHKLGRMNIRGIIGFKNV